MASSPREKCSSFHAKLKRESKSGDGKVETMACSQHLLLDLVEGNLFFMGLTSMFECKISVVFLQNSLRLKDLHVWLLFHCQVWESLAIQNGYCSISEGYSENGGFTNEKWAFFWLFFIDVLDYQRVSQNRGVWPRLPDFPGQWLRQCLLQSPGATGMVFRDPI